MEKSKVYILFEMNMEKYSSEKDIIGVISNPSNYKKILDLYYGDGRWLEVKFKDIRDSPLEWERTISLKECSMGIVELNIICQMFLVDDVL